MFRCDYNVRGHFCKVLEAALDFYYIMRSVLFEGKTKEQVEELLPCLGAQQRSYAKDEVIFPAGQPLHVLGVILKGDVRIEHVSSWGEVDILTIMEEGKTFGEAAACARGTQLMVDYVAERDCTVLFLDVERMLAPCPKGCPSHSRLVVNLVALLARRNLELARRAFVMTNHTMRAKVLSYLSTAAEAYGTTSFEIPYNREQLASYLGVDRSALSAELSRMQKAGLIRFHKNRFELLGPSDSCAK